MVVGFQQEGVVSLWIQGMSPLFDTLEESVTTTGGRKLDDFSGKRDSKVGLSDTSSPLSPHPQLRKKTPARQIRKTPATPRLHG